ncbi:hypothetical protein PGZ78_06825 [Klebsiella pneumoniae]|nr:hypothetical protein [Klebsiella pneumoniae]
MPSASVAAPLPPAFSTPMPVVPVAVQFVPVAATAKFNASRSNDNCTD